MGKKRFRLSHMIPNAWFYRLRDMNIATTPHHKTSKQQQQPENHPRNSLCYTPKIHQVDRNYNKKATQSTQDLLFSPTNCSFYESPLSESTQSLSSTCSSGPSGDNSKQIQDLSGYHELIQESEFQEKNEDTSSQSSISTETIYKYENPTKKLVSGVKMRSKAQREYICKRSIVYDIDDQNKLYSGSCCVVKATFDPLTELTESMMEMTMECNMHAPKDLEKLLTCYLSLNSSENHDNIVKAFKEVCLTFDFVV